MPGERKESQKVEAFSAPKELLRAAQIEAKRRRLSKSGFYRYCLAKELGRGEAESLRIAEHASIGNFQVINAGSVERIENHFTHAQAAPALGQKRPKRGKSPKNPQ